MQGRVIEGVFMGYDAETGEPYRAEMLIAVGPEAITYTIVPPDRSCPPVTVPGLRPPDRNHLVVRVFAEMERQRQPAAPPPEPPS